MVLHESTVTTTSTPDQSELRTDVSAPFLVSRQNQSIDGVIPQNPQVNFVGPQVADPSFRALASLLDIGVVIPLNIESSIEEHCFNVAENIHLPNLK